MITAPNNPPPGLGARLHQLVWGRRDPSSPAWQWWAVRVVRILSMLIHDVVDGQLTLRAMSLVYTTLLSIVPLLALSFSVLKAFGVSNQIRPILLQALEPLGNEGAVIADQILGFIENMNVGVLGALGLGLLLYTAISLMQKIEEALNHIWHIPQTRRFGERFSRYLSVLLVGPILVFSAIGLTATVMNIDTVRGLLELNLLSQAFEVLSRLMPYLLVITAFTFVYLFIPNTRVQLVPALIGGAVGGIAWQSAGWMFAIFVASSSSYAAIYSGFAIVILFMIWLYVSWLVLLFGASVAFYVQHPEYLYAGGGEPQLSNRVRERLALSMMSLVAGRFQRGETAPQLGQFTRAFGVPSHSMLSVVNALVRGQLLIQTDDDPARYLPARDPALIPVAAILQTVRTAGEDMYMTPSQLPVPAAVEAAIGHVDAAVEAALSTMNLRDLAGAGAPDGTREPDLGSVAPTAIDPAAGAERSGLRAPGAKPAVGLPHALSTPPL